MKNPAVVDAYIGAHEDVDLGVLTGRVAGELGAGAEDLLAEVEALEKVTEAARAEEEAK
jgi:branched-chain amino acid transport system ATP-binding protein